MTRTILPLLVALLAGTHPGTSGARAAAESGAGASHEKLRPNDNRRPAGLLNDGVLTLRLEARTGVWAPEGPDGVSHQVAAFAEEGGALQTPGPLVRVPQGTEVRVSVRNALERPLFVFGLGERRGAQGDSVAVAPGAVQEFRFVADIAGTYAYTARTSLTTPRRLVRDARDGQLHGAIVVDPPGARTDDRIFVISTHVAGDTATVGLDGRSGIMGINGLSWPDTEPLEATQGDTLRWRVLNLSALPHPMHLHGFYFRVDAKGDLARDTLYTEAERRLAVTENLRQGQTMAIVWTPERPGNWLFHCHIARHITSSAMIAEEMDRLVRRPSSGDDHGHGGHGEGVRTHAMGRLALGIRVRPNGVEPPAPETYRSLRLLIRSRPAEGADFPRYGYVLGGSAEESDPKAVPSVGPTLLLKRGEPVAVTVVNRSHEPAAVHWHGIELDSYPDGVPGWSGAGTNVLPAIPAGDSLTVRFTPPRAGTFMYHSHFNEHQQISSGLYGAIVVHEPKVPFDPDADRVLVFSDAGPTINTVQGPFQPALLNGRAQPEPMRMLAGRTYRLRLVAIRSDYPVEIALLAGDRPAAWRLVAKDGADLPAAQARVVPATVRLLPGEILDVAVTPEATAPLALRFGFPADFRPPHIVVPPPAVVPIHVAAK